MKEDHKRMISLQRAQELSEQTQAYRKAKCHIPIGMKMQEQFDISRKKLLNHFNASEEDWNDWHWQMDHVITSVDVLGKILDLTEVEKNVLVKLSGKYRWAVSPYYASLMTPGDPYGPIRLMGLPSVAELVYDTGDMDPMNEQGTNPAGSITRRYPDRLIINVTNRCANYCRFCQRRRNIGQVDQHKDHDTIQESIDYIKANPEIRDVLITGGDALMLENGDLEWIISSIRSIPHVEIIRIGTRTPVTLPQRITKELCDMLRKYHPLFINTHFNHPQEVTKDSKRATEMLANSGIPLGNQMVLLNGVNNNKYVVAALNHELLKIRVKPYYIFHPKQVQGTGHFYCSIDDGLEIMEYLRGRTSGLAIPTYIINAPGGLGKTPLLPSYLISRGKGSMMIRTWEGKVLNYSNPPTRNMKEILKQAQKQILEKE